MFAQMLNLFGSLGPTELLIILFIILLLFGARKIPDLAKGLGRGVKEFRDASREIRREIDTETSNNNTSAPERKVETGEIRQVAGTEVKSKS